mmetsp:Transcript_18384/g.26974  ORF Transcript_18384/g.26974 Transcript_18384/m.26974 type:complete len:122 (+) Transcript_18384:346-711(+)
MEEVLHSLKRNATVIGNKKFKTQSTYWKKTPMPFYPYRHTKVNIFYSSWYALYSNEMCTLDGTQAIILETDISMYSFTKKSVCAYVNPPPLENTCLSIKQVSICGNEYLSRMCVRCKGFSR